MLFQGEEWGASAPFQYFTAHDDPSWADRCLKDGAESSQSSAGIPRDSRPSGDGDVRRSRLDWNERAQPIHAGLLAWYRALIALRREHPRLRDGDYRRVHVDGGADGQPFTMRRGEIELVCNLSNRVASIGLNQDHRVLLVSTPAMHMEGDWLRLPPESVAILKRS